MGGQIGPEAATLNLSVKESKRFGTEMRRKTVDINWGAVEAKSGLSMEMEEILDIVDLFGCRRYLRYCGIYHGLSEERRIFLGKWEKCCDLSGDLLLMQGGSVHCTFYSRRTSRTVLLV